MTLKDRTWFSKIKMVRRKNWLFRKKPFDELTNYLYFMKRKF